MAQRRIFSGIQPSGVPHLGNYLGAIQNWVKLQSSDQVLYSIVDLHALTVPQNAGILRASIRNVAASLLACGVDPNKSVIFQQSKVPQHSELAWILTCHTPLGWLRRMTQFKSKAKVADNLDVFSSTVLTGLFTYPTLMAADILLYQTTHVPVGEDQEQHVEFTRDIARAFNYQYSNPNLFVEPQVLVSKGYRIMSLRDGRTKMSKSDDSDLSRINLDDSSDTIANKIRRAKTDMLSHISYDPVNRPEVSNLLRIYAALSGHEPETLPSMLGLQSAEQLKREVTELVIYKLQPIRAEIKHFQNDPSFLDSVLKEGASKAQLKAQTGIDNIRSSLGID